MPTPPENAPSDKTRQTDPSRAPTNPGDEAPAGAPGTGETVCRSCGGSGQIDGKACAACGGSGRINVGIGGG